MVRNFIIFIIGWILAIGTKGWSYSSWEIQTVDTSDNTGFNTSIELDSNNYPHISYIRNSATDDNDNLMYAKYNGSGWEIQIVEQGYVRTYSTGIDIYNDQPHIVYIRCINNTESNPNNRVRYAEYNGTGWEIQYVDSDTGYVQWPSIVVESNGEIHIAYGQTGDIQYPALKYAHYNGSGWTVEVVYNPGNYRGEAYTSIDLDFSGYPHISWYQEGDLDLRYAKYNGSDWEIQLVESAGNVGAWTSLKVDSSGNPHIAYVVHDSNQIKYAYYNGTGWEIQVVYDMSDESIYPGFSPSLELDAQENPLISFYDKDSQDLKIAIYNGSGWFIQTPDAINNVGEYSSLAIDSYGYAHISYYYQNQGNLKYAKGYSEPSIMFISLIGVILALLFIRKQGILANNF